MKKEELLAGKVSSKLIKCANLVVTKITLNNSYIFTA